MKWKRTAIINYPGDLWEDWDKLNARYYGSHPTLQSRFVRSLTQFFPDELEVMAAYNQGEITALVLLLSSNGIIVKSYLPSQATLALALVPIEISDFLPLCKTCLPWQASRIDILSVDPKYQEGILKSKGIKANTKATDMVVNLSGDFEHYWNARPRKLRKNIVRYCKRIINDLGTYELKVSTLPLDVDIAVARYGFLESRGWKGKSETSLHPGNTQGNFYSDVMKNFSSTTEAFVFELRVNDTLLASRLCITNGELVVALKTTFDEAYKKYATGRILLYEVLKYLCDQTPFKLLDFYTNADHDQLEWATETRPISNTSIYLGINGAILRAATVSKELFLAKLTANI